MNHIYSMGRYCVIIMSINPNPSNESSTAALNVFTQRLLFQRVGAAVSSLAAVSGVGARGE